MEQEQEKLAYTAEEVGKMLNVQARTVWSYIHKGKLHAAKIGRKWIITRKALDDFLYNGTR